jgi:hypothetical protein
VSAIAFLPSAQSYLNGNARASPVAMWD